jgi:hypothetical protein
MIEYHYESVCDCGTSFDSYGETKTDVSYDEKFNRKCPRCNKNIKIVNRLKKNEKGEILEDKKY